ncbi:MAG: hypothetical protein IJ981_05815 [Clostridia bacterium]|nr:hypothetical protein [Clostridia bacterium]MBR2397276.1 hypothetical protein [Clostridia bacterium]
MNIDFDKLREELIDYFGTAMGTFPIAVMNVAEVESASDRELIRIATQNGFDLSDYEI